MHVRPGIHQLLCEQIPEYLRSGKLPAWEIEDKLAKLFNVTDEELSQMYENTNTPVWRNDVSWVLSELVYAGKNYESGKQTCAERQGRPSRCLHVEGFVARRSCSERLLTNQRRPWRSRPAGLIRDSADGIVRRFRRR
jgi:hypothetical protein